MTKFCFSRDWRRLFVMARGTVEAAALLAALGVCALVSAVVMHVQSSGPGELVGLVPAQRELEKWVVS